MIIDSHAHVFPALATAPGYENPDEHRALMQRVISAHHQPVRRSIDNAIAPHTIWHSDDPSPAGQEDVNFRIGRFGRFEWTKDGVDYYKQYLPPSMYDNACSAAYLVSEMNYAGVDRVVLQNDSLYGKLNKFFAECVRQYPDRLIASVYIPETAVNQAERIDELNHAVTDLRARALFYGGLGFWLDGGRSHLDDLQFDRFWQEVERLGLVVFLSPGGAPVPGPTEYLKLLRQWAKVLERHPNLSTVLVNGLSWSLLKAYPVALPEEVKRLVQQHNFFIELIFPIGRGHVEEYPYAASLEQVRYLYHECGPRALVWGSDMPNILRYCTYAQSLAYLRQHTDFIPDQDMALILGGNLIAALALEQSSPA